MIIDSLLRGVVAPVVTLIVVMLAGQPLWRTGKRRQYDPLPALGCGVAQTVAYLAMFGWPGMPPKEHWQRILILIWISTGVAWIAPLITRHSIARIIGYALTAIVVAWMVFPPWDDYADRRSFWIGGLAVLILANLESTSHLSRKRHGLAPLFMLTIGTTLASIVVVLAHNAKLAQICGAVAAVMGFLFLICLRMRSRESVLGVVAIPSILVPALAFLAFFYDSDGQSFPTEFVLASVTPLMVAIVTLFPVGRLKGLKQWVVAQLLCIIPVAIGVVMLLMSAGGEEP
jgi:hypothetical protein